jgi:hypothetical protein
MFVRKASATEEQTGWTTWLYHQRNPSIHMSDGMKVTSLSASLLQKIITGGGLKRDLPVR